MVDRKEQLAAKVECFKLKTYAESTQKSYATHLRKYTLFCKEFNFNPVPATQHQIELYIAYLTESLKYQSILKYINIIRIMHLEYGYPNPMQDNFAIKCLLRGVRRELGDTVKRKLPITPDILAKIQQHLDFSNMKDIMFWAACLVGFYCMLRKSNLFPPTSAGFDPEKHLSRSHIEEKPWGLLLTLVWTKTIQFHQRVVKCPLVRCGSLCPVDALSHVLSASPGATQLGPVFVYKDGKGAYKPYLYNHFLTRMKSVVKAIGLDPKQYAGHSLRRGGATWALRCGVPGEVIRAMGDWRSDAYLQYLEVDWSLKLRYVGQMAKCMAK